MPLYVSPLFRPNSRLCHPPPPLLYISLAVTHLTVQRGIVSIPNESTRGCCVSRRKSTTRMTMTTILRFATRSRKDEALTAMPDEEKREEAAVGGAGGGWGKRSGGFGNICGKCVTCMRGCVSLFRLAARSWFSSRQRHSVRRTERGGE